MRSPSPAAALLALALASTAAADARVQVSADVPAEVRVNGEFVGNTPLRVTGLAPGLHRIDLRDPASGQGQSFQVRSPRTATVEKSLHGTFYTARRAPAVTYSYAPAPVVHLASPVVVPARPAYCPTPAYTGYRSHGYGYGYGRHGSRRQRAKVHTRNGLLGFTAATHVIGGHRKGGRRLRNMGLGALLLNEVLR